MEYIFIIIPITIILFYMGDKISSLEQRIHDLEKNNNDDFDDDDE